MWLLFHVEICSYQMVKWSIFVLVPSEALTMSSPSSIKWYIICISLNTTSLWFQSYLVFFTV